MIRARGMELVYLGLSMSLFFTFAVVTFWETTKLVHFVPYEFVFAGLFAVALYTLLLTVMTEPGLVPTLATIEKVHADPQLRERNKRALKSLNHAYWDYYSPESTKAMPDDYCLYVHHNSPAAITFYECSTCRVYRPSWSTSHCSEPSCNGCVRGKDHHCKFLGTCIGDRNRQNFLALLVSMTLCGIFSMTMLGFTIASHVRLLSRRGLPIPDPVSTAEIVLGGIFLGLLVFKFVVFPLIFSFMTNFKILLVIIVYGFGAVIFMATKGHVPVLAGIVGYMELSCMLFIVTNLVYQLMLVKRGMTVKQMINAQAERDETTRLIGDSQNDPGVAGAVMMDERSWKEVGAFILAGFRRTDMHSFQLNI